MIRIEEERVKLREARKQYANTDSKYRKRDLYKHIKRLQSGIREAEKWMRTSGT